MKCVSRKTDLHLNRDDVLEFVYYQTQYNCRFFFLAKTDDGPAQNFSQDEDTETPLLDDEWVSRIMITSRTLAKLPLKSLTKHTLYIY